MVKKTQKTGHLIEQWCLKLGLHRRYHLVWLGSFEQCIVADRGLVVAYPLDLLMECYCCGLVVPLNKSAVHPEHINYVHRNILSDQRNILKEVTQQFPPPTFGASRSEWTSQNTVQALNTGLLTGHFSGHHLSLIGNLEPGQRTTKMKVHHNLPFLFFCGWSGDLRLTRFDFHLRDNQVLLGSSVTICLTGWKLRDWCLTLYTWNFRLNKSAHWPRYEKSSRWCFNSGGTATISETFRSLVRVVAQHRKSLAQTVHA